MTLACERENKFWTKKGISFDENARKYADVMIAYKHLVMIFVPTAKVRQLYAQGLFKGNEYKHQYNIALQDPSNWQPMEPTRTFNQFPQYHFDVSAPQQLRVVEATESYKMVNLLYKEFDKDQNTKGYKDVDEEDKAFSYIKYQHKGDSTSEWRPAMASTGEADEDGKDKAPQGKQYKVDWCFKPYTPKGKEPEETSTDVADVMLVPRVPLMANVFDPYHEEVLDQAKALRSLGRSDWDIEAELNKQLTQRWKDRAQAKKEGSQRKPPKITVDIIRTFISRQDQLAKRQDDEEEDAKADATSKAEAKDSSRPAK